jgi:hypothetical protein
MPSMEATREDLISPGDRTQLEVMASDMERLWGRTAHLSPGNVQQLLSPTLGEDRQNAEGARRNGPVKTVTGFPGAIGGRKNPDSAGRGRKLTLRQRTWHDFASASILRGSSRKR